MWHMRHVYQIWVRNAGLVQCRIAGPDVTYFGEGRRGYLTKPAIEFCDAEGQTQFRIGGNRRLAHEPTFPGHAIGGTSGDVQHAAHIGTSRRRSSSG